MVYSIQWYKTNINISNISKQSYRTKGCIIEQKAAKWFPRASVTKYVYNFETYY